MLLAMNSHCSVTNVVLSQHSVNAGNARNDTFVTCAVQLSAVLNWSGGVTYALAKKQWRHKH